MVYRAFYRQEKDILNSIISFFFKYSQEYFFLPQEKIFLQQKIYSWDKNFFLRAKFFLLTFRKKSCYKKIFFLFQKSKTRATVYSEQPLTLHLSNTN